MTMQNGDLSEAFDHYQLTRSDHKVLATAPYDILCCCVVRNEALRCPTSSLSTAKKALGNFFLLTMASTDGTLAYLLEQPDVYVWQSPYSFNRANFGSAWFELLLREHGVGCWCLIVDADELLYYPECESKSLVQLCQELDDKNKRAFTAVLLEMYSDQAIRDTHYTSGQRFEDVCPYFDRRFYHGKFDDAGPYHNQTVYFGGVRQRVFGAAGDFISVKCRCSSTTPRSFSPAGNTGPATPRRTSPKRAAVCCTSNFSLTFMSTSRKKCDGKNIPSTPSSIKNTRRA